MRLHTNTNNVTRSSSFEESNFTIDATAKAFSILSDGLYSNKVLAVIRELSTNAYDSHISAGCPDKRFDVFLPTTLEHTFHIRDYGTGLSYDDCMSLYTTYFKSDKTDSNDAVGCLGLGSKSPFAYTDQFLVESFYNGKHMTFSAYKNEDDEPVFAHMSTEDTTEPTGLKISFATKPDDKWSFMEEAEVLYQNFDKVPNTNVSIDIKPVVKIFEGSNWYVRKQRHVNSVIMGQIEYTLDDDQFDGEIHDFLNSFRGLCIKANIGDVDITPSRESLSYNKRTKDNLVSIISGILVELNSTLEQNIKSSDTLWEARSRYVKIWERTNTVKGVRECLEGIKTWNNQDLFDEIHGFSVKTSHDTIRFSKSRWRTTIERDEVERIRIHGNTDNKFGIFYEDVKKGAVGKVRYLLKENWNEGVVHLIRGDITVLESVCKSLGMSIDDVKNVSELESPPKSNSSGSRSYYTGKPCRILTKQNGEWMVTDAKVSVKEEDAFYFKTNRDSAYIGSAPEANLEIYKIKSLIESLENTGQDMSVLDGKVFFMTPSTAKSMKLRERDNWTPADEYIKSELEWVLKTKKDDFIKFLNSKSESNHWSDDLKGTDLKGRDLKVAIELSSADCEVLNNWMSVAYPELSCEVSDFQCIKLYCIKFKIFQGFKDKFENELKADEALEDMIMEKYPMISMCTRWWNSEEGQLQILADYINLVNKGDK